MVVGFLVIGILGGSLAGGVALAFGHGLGIAGLAYMLGAMLGLGLGLVWSFLWALVARQLDLGRQQGSKHSPEHGH